MGDAHRDAHARVITRQRGVKAGSPQGSFLNSAGVPAAGPAIPPNTPGGEFLNRESHVRVAPGALSSSGAPAALDLVSNSGWLQRSWIGSSKDEWAAVYLLAAPLVLAISPVVRNRPTPIGLWLRPSATDRATSASGLSFPIASHG